jgi:hypothetical protein
MSDLLANAALVRVDVYDGAVAQCAGASVNAAAPPLLSRSFAHGATVRLDIPPGQRTIVMTTYADADGHVESGTACVAADLSGGRTACVSLSLVAVDGGMAGCTTSPDSCPAGQYCTTAAVCDVGCKTGADCTGATKVCDPARHQCVQCLSTGDCASGLFCSPSGTCTTHCTTNADCTGGRSCCRNICIDTRSDPLNCNACGAACVGTNTLCCNGQCTNPAADINHCGDCATACSTLNGTPSCSGGTCAWTCNTGFVHCASGNTGCEVDDTTVYNCGGCGTACTPTNAIGDLCNAGVCGYTCGTGFLDCVKNGANLDGCETPYSITNCGACGNACDTVNSTGATCPAGTCLYAPCPSPRADCNMANSDVDGCECPTPICCGTGGTMCQQQHMNGLGQTYYDGCTLAGAYSLMLADAAASAWTDATDPSPAPRTCPGNIACVQRTSATDCAVWCYTKGLAGYVVKSPLATCSCPTMSSTMWN